MIKRRMHKQGVVLGAGIALIAIGALIGSSVAHAQEKLKFALNWPTPTGSFMQFYAAQKAGLL